MPSRRLCRPPRVRGAGLPFASALPPRFRVAFLFLPVRACLLALVVVSGRGSGACTAGIIACFYSWDLRCETMGTLRSNVTKAKKAARVQQVQVLDWRVRRV